jgi:hypothetical protein
MSYHMQQHKPWLCLGCGQICQVAMPVTNIPMCSTCIEDAFIKLQELRTNRTVCHSSSPSSPPNPPGSHPQICPTSAELNELASTLSQEILSLIRGDQASYVAMLTCVESLSQRATARGISQLDTLGVVISIRLWSDNTYRIQFSLSAIDGSWELTYNTSWKLYRQLALVSPQEFASLMCKSLKLSLMRRSSMGATNSTPSVSAT